MTATDLRVDAGYAPVPGGLRVYWRSLGQGGTPLVPGPRRSAGSPPVRLVHGDADGIPPAHAAEFSALVGSACCSALRAARLCALLGRGLRDAGWDGSGRPASRLAVLPGRTRHDASSSPELAVVVEEFLGRPGPGVLSADPESRDDSA